MLSTLSWMVRAGARRARPVPVRSFSTTKCLTASHILVEPLQSKISSGEITERPTPVLFIPGMFGSAAHFEKYFQHYFATKGYTSVAVDMDYTYRSGKTDEEFIDSLVDQVASVGRSQMAPPIIVGHGLGGYVCQKYLESHPAAGVVLLSSFAPSTDDAVVEKKTQTAMKLHQALVRAQSNSNDAEIRADLLHSMYREFAEGTVEDAGVPRLSQLHMEKWFDRDFIQKANVLDPMTVTKLLAATGRVPCLFEADTGVPMLLVGANSDPITTLVDTVDTALTYGLDPDDCDVLEGSLDIIVNPDLWKNYAKHILFWAGSYGL
eukprot:Clim_evm20s206 gene=Clim_evmTU20s206